MTNKSARQAALDDIDRVLAIKPENNGTPAVYEMAVVLGACVERWAPPGSIYRRIAAERLDKPSERHTPAKAALRALRRDIDAEATSRFEELINSALLSDIIEQGEHLLSSGYAQAAVVLFGGALEEHLRKLAAANGAISLTNNKGEPQKAAVLNDQLAKANDITKADRDLVHGWLKIRNLAAHGDKQLTKDYGEQDFRLMATGVRGLIARFPA